MFNKKESVDILDLPELHRRKIISLPESNDKEIESKISNDGFFDLSQDPINKNPIHTSNEESTNLDNQQSNFLNDFASIGLSNNSITSENNSSKVEESDNIKDLKWRIENLEFKIEQLIERINSIEGKSS